MDSTLQEALDQQIITNSSEPVSIFEFCDCLESISALIIFFHNVLLRKVNKIYIGFIMRLFFCSISSHVTCVTVA